MQIEKKSPNIYLLGVAHNMNPNNGSLVHESIVPIIWETFGKKLRSKKTLIIAEDAQIDTNIHHCKCGTLLVDDTARAEVLQKIFHKDHSLKLNRIHADITIADVRHLENADFSQYRSVVSEFFKTFGDTAIRVIDPKAYMDYQYRNFKKFHSMKSLKYNGDPESSYLITEGIVMIDREAILRHLQKYLGHGIPAHRKFLEQSLITSTDDTMFNALQHHLKHGAYNDIIIVAGGIHVENLHQKVSGAIIQNYVFRSFAPAQTLLDYMEQSIGTPNEMGIHFLSFAMPTSYLWTYLESKE